MLGVNYQKGIMKIVLKIVGGLALLAIIGIGASWVYIMYFGLNSEPNWHVEKNAVRSESHPLAGFYKDEGCKDPWGWAIGPINNTQYYISFCGPGGCFAEGTYRPNTPIYGDSKYEVVDENTIKFLSKEGWSTHVRCLSRT